MSSRSPNKAILAAAGSRKTTEIVEAALACGGRVLVTTYTNENQRLIMERIARKAGAVPPNIQVMGWFAFLISQCAKPYQRAITGAPLIIQGLNFKGERNRYLSKTEPMRYYFDSHHALYRNGVSDFVCELDEATNGAVVSRLDRVYDHIFVDEVQDLVGYDLDVLDLLMASGIHITVVGDPRQHTYSTNRTNRNKKYQGHGLFDWFNERAEVCELVTRDCSYRCNQAICDFADTIYPELPSTVSVDVDETGHDGVFTVPVSKVPGYAAEYRPQVLRHDKNVNTLGLPGMNIGKSKGSTFDRVLIFPTKPMLGFLANKDASKLKAPEELYVAVTRARFSAAFVVPDP